MIKRRTPLPRGSRPGRAIAATAVFLALAAGGCGADDDGGDGGAATAQEGAEAAVMATIDEMKAALRARDARGICRVMSARALAGLPPAADGRAQSCRKVFGGAAGAALSEDPNPRVLEIEVDGATATATARSARAAGVQHAAFAREDGGWKVVGWFTD